MSTVVRLVSGSMASWAKIGITMLTQLLLVPFYLTYWDVKTYGIWIAIMAMVDIVNTLDKGHQNYLGFEFLRTGAANREVIRKYLWSGVWVSMAISLLQLTFVVLVITAGFLPALLGEKFGNDYHLIAQAGSVLIMQSFSWMISTSLSGLFGRVLAPFGYAPRMSWWAVVYSIFSAITPVIAVSFGADLVMAGWVFTLTAIIFSIFQYGEIFRLLKKLNITYCKPDFGLGFKNFSRSIILSFRELLEATRRQGVRLILAPLLGPAGVIAFATMRTGANIAFQGLNTITNPLMPELMRFLNNRDQQRMEASFATVWMVLLFLLAPGVLILQAFIEPVFMGWTKGHVKFDPFLFALLSQGILVYAAAQPAMAVMRGNNILRPQIAITLIAAIVVVVGILIFVPSFGIVGAGIALLVAEVAATTGYRLVAKKWMNENGLKWPDRSSGIASTSVWTAAVAMFLMIQFPSIKWIVFAGGLIILGYLIWLYWASMPELVKQKARQTARKLPLLKRVF